MKKIDTTLITVSVGMPIKKGTIDFLQQAYQEALNALAQAMVGNTRYSSSIMYRLFGVDITTAFSSGNITYNITAGAVFYNGEVYLVNTQSLTFPATGTNTFASRINTAYFSDAAADPVTFTDSSTHNVHQILTIGFYEDTTGSGPTLGIPVNIPMTDPITTAEWTSVQTFSFQSNKVIIYDATSLSSNVFQLNAVNASPGATVRIVATFSTGATLSLTTLSGQTIYVLQGDTTIAGGVKEIRITYLGAMSGTDYFEVSYFN